MDLPACDQADADTLHDVFGFHPLALRDTVERNHVAKLHVYADYVFLVLHSPEIGEHGHVHYVELDQFIGTNYLVAVHGPYATQVTADVAGRDTMSTSMRMRRAISTMPQTTTATPRALVSAAPRSWATTAQNCGADCP